LNHEIHGGEFAIRIFKANRTGNRTRQDASDMLVDHARIFNADLHILKGVDGGVGSLLIREYLEKDQRPLAFILGGSYRSRYHSLARIVFYESDVQKQRLMASGWRFWQTRPTARSLIRLPKWVDDQVFAPQRMEKKWDILVVGRLFRPYKNYDALGPLSAHFRVAVIGDGEDAHRLRTTYPEVQWLGFVPNYKLPEYINRARLFMHTSFKDFYPRVIAEALSCGVPSVGFAGSLAEDVIPAGCGMLLNPKDYIVSLKELLSDETGLEQMGERALQHARAQIGRDACLAALNKMFNRLADDT
jgi:glycosyltransferase involved in cell wall biosynthesis